MAGKSEILSEFSDYQRQGIVLAVVMLDQESTSLAGVVPPQAMILSKLWLQSKRGELAK